jgi:excisionase family DNA binding protein
MDRRQVTEAAGAERTDEFGGRLLLTPEAGAYAIGVSRAQMYKLLTSGEIASIKIGRLRRVPVAALRRWIAEQVDAA